MDQLEQCHLEDHLDKHDVHIEDETTVCWYDDSKTTPPALGSILKVLHCCGGDKAGILHDSSELFRCMSYVRIA